MARCINRLSATLVAKTSKVGLHGDGAGLWLQVTASKSGGVTKSWLFRYMLGGKAKSMGLGPTHTISLAEAREKAKEFRKLLLDGKDPLAERDNGRAERKAAAAKAMSFNDCASAYIEAHKAGWRNVKHEGQWRSTLETYASPVFGTLAVAQVDTGLVMRALEPIWTSKTETASRLRARIENVLDWATVRGHRQGENPARWRGHLDKLLPKRSKVARVEHHAALPYRQMPEFISDLRRHEGIAPCAFELCILAVTRTSETLGAQWREIDLNLKIWTIPPMRMKGQKEHRIPLSSRAIEILEQMAAIRQSDYVFSGIRPGKPLSNMVFLMILRRMGKSDLTAHGFRSTFRDWVSESTAFPGELAEMALAHVVANKVEASYRRGDLFEKRRILMQSWADFLSTPIDGGVIELRRGT